MSALRTTNKLMLSRGVGTLYCICYLVKGLFIGTSNFYIYYNANYNSSGVSSVCIFSRV